MNSITGAVQEMQRVAELPDTPESVKTWLNNLVAQLTGAEGPQISFRKAEPSTHWKDPWWCEIIAENEVYNTVGPSPIHALAGTVRLWKMDLQKTPYAADMMTGDGQNMWVCKCETAGLCQSRGRCMNMGN